MPVRVRCRCGQELVLRYGEWVYFFLGLALLCLVVNMLALLLLYLRLEEISRSRDSHALPVRTTVDPEARPGPDLISPAGPDGLPRETTPALRPAGTATPGSPALPREHPSPGDPSRPAAENVPPGGDAAPRREGDGTPRAQLERSTAPAGQEPGAQPLVSLESVAEVFLPPGPPPRSEAPLEVTALAAEKPAGWVHELPFLRLFLMEQSSEPELFSCALLSDPDTRLRAFALKKALGFSVRSLRDPAAARRLVQAAWESLSGDPEGRRCLAAFGVQGPAAAEGEPAGEAGAFLESLRGRLEEASSRALSEGSPGALKAFLAKHEKQGTELVLLVDASESMKGPLRIFQARAEWLLRALSWAFPGIRAGAVIYRDGVEVATGFSTGSLSGLAAAIRQATPEGGGDVPEGVHLALRAALELGRFDWRPSAMKTIVVLGDAPPPYGEVSGLLGLASRAFRQGGYRVHAIGFKAEEDRKTVPFFPELARSGGGRSVTIEGQDDVALAVVRSLFTDDALPAVDLLLPALRSLAWLEE